MQAGYADRMMLEFSPDRSFGVLSPAFKGNEMGFATNQAAAQGCNFLQDNLCELHGTGFQPLECRFCHHDRMCLGLLCHVELEKDWNTLAGQARVVRWGEMTGFWERYRLRPPERTGSEQVK